MQLLLVRHALPLRSEPGQGSDPDLSDEPVWSRPRRLPEALARFPVSRLVSSPQRRAVQTAAPVADALGLTVEIDDRIAEYDRDLPQYVPIEQIAAENPEELQRLVNGQLPSGVDEAAFRARITAAVDDLVAGGDHDDTVAVFSHGGVINVLLHQILGTAAAVVVPRRLRVDHPAALLALRAAGGGCGQRHRARMGPAAEKPAVVDKSDDFFVTRRARPRPPWTATCGMWAFRAPVSCGPS